MLETKLKSITIKSDFHRCASSDYYRLDEYSGKAKIVFDFHQHVMMH